MLPRFSHILRPLNLPSSASAFPMARAITTAAHLHFYPAGNDAAAIHSSLHLGFVRFTTNRFNVSFSSKSLICGRRFHALCGNEGQNLSSFGGVRAEQRGYRKTRKRVAKSKEKELELSVDICIEEELPDDSEILVYLTSALWFLD